MKARRRPGRGEPGRTGPDHRSQHAGAAERIRWPEAQGRDCTPWRSGCHANREHGEDQSRAAAVRSFGARRSRRRPAESHSGRAWAPQRRMRLRGAAKVAIAHTLCSKPATAARSAAEERCICQKEPATLVRIVGQAPLEATVFEMERLRCNACGQIFTADEPEAAGPDKYDETAVAMIALLKYGSGVPFQPIGKAASNNWECRCRRRRSGILSEAAAEQIRPALEELIRQAAQGERDAQRRHRHADSAPGARAGRQADRYVHQRHRIDWSGHGPLRCSSPDGSMRARTSRRC